jgi:hypothetical protein
MRKKSDALVAFFDIDTNSLSRQSAMPGSHRGDQRFPRHEERRLHHVEDESAAAALVEELRDVRVLLETVVRDDLEEIAAQRLGLVALVRPAPSGLRRSRTVRNTMRSCSTLLCFRLCSSACGTELATR